MRPYTGKEMAKITASAVAALAMTGLLFAIAYGLLITPRW
jgi:hypothetical protein